MEINRMINKVEIEGRIITYPNLFCDKKLAKFLIQSTDWSINHLTGQKYLRSDSIWVVIWGKYAYKVASLNIHDMVQIKGHLRVKSMKIHGVYKTLTSIEAKSIKYSHFGSQYRDLFSGKF